MHIAYVTVHVAPEIMQGGVGKKIKNQISIWREQGHEATLFTLTPTEILFPETRQFIFDSQSKLLKREISRSKFLEQMIASIRDYKPDIIYLRYGLYSYPLHRLFEIAPVVVEINSNDLVEYRSRGVFFYWTNRLTRNLTLGPANGIIAPTHELADTLAPKHSQPVCVISNGLDLKEVEILPSPGNTKPVITLVGSPGMNWHGVDKLIKFAGLYADLEVNIAGYVSQDVDSSVPENIHLLGFLDKPNLREVLSMTDVTCGTLALHRKKMDEACPLKVRESLAYGIPVIIAYRDTDLDEVNLDTILRIPNTEDNVTENAERIRKFAYDMMGRRVDINAVAPYLDQRKKEEIRLAFFQEILTRTSEVS